MIFLKTTQDRAVYFYIGFLVYFTVFLHNDFLKYQSLKINEDISLTVIVNLSLLRKQFLGFPSGLDGKKSICNVGDLGSILAWEDLLEQSMATLSNSLLFPGKSPWIDEPGKLQSMGLQRVGYDRVAEHSTQHSSGKNEKTR